MNKIDKLIKQAIKISPAESVFMAFIEENEEATSFQLRAHYWNGKPGSGTRVEETMHSSVEEAEAYLMTLDTKAPIVFIDWGLSD